MATYQFSALADDQAVVFNPDIDLLFFDQDFIRADRVRVTTEGANIRVRVESINKDVVLLNTTQFQLATSNVSFADPGRLLFGDNSPSQAADNAANLINGTGGSDLLAGFGGADTMNGGQGHDTYIVSSGDVLSDPGGIDTVESDVSWALGASFENLKLTGSAAITANGNNLNNWLVGNDASNSSINGRGGDDIMWGMGGDDTFDMSTGGTSSYGNDQIDGGEGSDTVAFGANARGGVAIRLEGEFGSMSGGGEGGAGSATLFSIENAAGGSFNDTIIGGDGANFLRGEGGSDILDGRAGNDRLQGGAGNDSFLFSVAPDAANADALVDFASGADKIRLDADVMTALGPAGNFTSGDARFWASSAGTAHDASDRVIYNTSTRQLFYDADGNGSGGAQLLFTLQPGATLAATDIAVDNGAPSGNVINGSAGDDSLTGTFGDDTINGLGGNDSINGNGGQDSLVGGDGDDHIANGREELGNTLGDTLIGGNGNDVLDAQGGGGFSSTHSADTLDGGAGNDYFYIDFGDVVSDSGGIDTIEAADTSWTLADGFEHLRINTDLGEGGANGTGNALDNEMWLTWGGGRLEGLAGNDTLHGGEKESTLVGGDGNDLLTGNWRSILEGGAGNDTLVGGGTSTGGAGADHFDFTGLNDFSDSVGVSDFASGSDRIRLNGERLDGTGASGDFASGDQRFHAAAGATAAHDASDRVIYNSSTGDLYYDPDGTGSQLAFRLTTLQGAPSLAATDFYVINGTAAGGEHLVGTSGNDSLVGGAGDDTLEGMAGNDTMRGGDGNDHYYVSTGDVIVENAVEGTDTVHSDISWALGNNFEDLTLLAGAVTANGNSLDNALVGNDGNNSSINGRAGNDTMLGMGGNDVFDMSTGGTSSYGNDVIDGGTGTDSVEFGNNARTAVNINLAAGTVSGGGDGGVGGATLTRIENALGGNFNDTLTGDSGANYFRGWNGNDTLNGGAGNDRLQGDAGNDAFVFDAIGTANSDTIIGFASGADKVHLENSVMTALGAAGAFVAGDVRYWEAAGATSGHDANDRVIYNTSNGNLYYDADGSGSGASQLIATLQGAPGFTDTDVFVI